MPQTTYIVEWNEGRGTKVHVIVGPSYGESGFYRQTESWNAFRTNAHRIGAQSIRDGDRATRFHVRWGGDFEADMESEQRTIDQIIALGKTPKLPRTADLPRIEHADCKAFYAFVGYNTKKRKFG
jgi:hypothetical protein